MSVLKVLPSKARLAEVRKTSFKIFDQFWNPNAKRNPNKILRAPLKGPEYVKYYGDNNAVPTFKDFKKWFPQLKLVDPREAHRVFIVADRKEEIRVLLRRRNNNFMCIFISISLYIQLQIYIQSLF